jgi:thioredoxin 1
MKYKITLIAILLFTLNIKAQNIKVLHAKAFETEIKTKPKAFVIDVRTANEFSNGHILNATNSDWKNGNFKTQTAKIDKNEPVYLYCLSGGRSDLAAKYLMEEGFKNVSVLDGGMMKWRAENLPETAKKTPNIGMDLVSFQSKLKSDKLVLVDFYADWCIPCQQMKPFIDKIAKTKKDRVDVLRINTEENSILSKELNIVALPVIKLYKNSKVVAEHNGFIDEKDLLKLIESVK